MTRSTLVTIWAELVADQASPAGHVSTVAVPADGAALAGACSGMDIEHNKAVIREFDELGNGGGDIDRIDALCTPDIVNHALAPGRPQGIEGTREFLRSARRNVHPVRWIESHVVAESDLVVQFGTREQYWPGGSFRGFEIPSGLFRRDTAFAYLLVDGRISERWAIRDDLGMMLQLGAIIEPAP